VVLQLKTETIYSLTLESHVALLLEFYICQHLLVHHMKAHTYIFIYFLFLFFFFFLIIISMYYETMSNDCKAFGQLGFFSPLLL